MTANAFGIAFCTVSVIVRKVCDVIARVLGPKYIKLPSNDQQMKDLVKGMEEKYGFPQTFECVDGTHIAINQPTENPHDYFSYKQNNCHKLLLSVREPSVLFSIKSENLKLASRSRDYMRKSTIENLKTCQQ